MKTWQEYLGNYSSGITLNGVFPESDFQAILTNIYGVDVETQIQELADDSLGYIGIYCDLDKLEQKSLKILIEKYIRLKMFERHEAYMSHDEEKVARMEKEYTKLLEIARDTQEHSKSNTTTSKDDKRVFSSSSAQVFTEEFFRGS